MRGRFANYFYTFCCTFVGLIKIAQSITPTKLRIIIILQDTMFSITNRKAYQNITKLQSGKIESGYVQDLKRIGQGGQKNERLTTRRKEYCSCL